MKPSKKIRQKQIQKQENKWHWKMVKLPLEIIVSTAIVLYSGASFYVDRKLDSAYQSRYNSLKGTGFATKEKQFHPFWHNPSDLLDDLRLLNRIRSMEQDFEGGLESFIRFVDSEKYLLATLTSSSVEEHGYVERMNDTFQIKKDQTWYDELKQYVSELIAGDFSHKDKVIYYLNQYPEIFLTQNYANEKNRFITGIHIAEQYHKVMKLPPDSRKNLGLRVIIESGEFLMFNPEKSKKVYDSTMQWLAMLKKKLDMSSMGTTKDEEFLKNDSIFSRFHTHPLNDKNYDPSPPDIANTHIVGPNILFSQSNGVLHVYAIHKGNSREIYTSRISH